MKHPPTSYKLGEINKEGRDTPSLGNRSIVEFAVLLTCINHRQSLVPTMFGSAT